ncbi:IQ motif and ankyrin repeat domain-containing protein 1 [Geodia barretti]|nr:IQ motif and ankyrin repeat domain-containing protein 1 [Geodia barretti]
MLVECSDANGNTPLSEAAAGGDPDTINFLLSLEANPNKKGQYGRTPLYRAAFAGHAEAVKILLKSGADPRITADDGERPDQVSSNPEVEDIFKEWKPEDTDHLLKRLDGADKKRKEAQNKLFETIESKLRKLADDAEKEYSAKQRELRKAHEELNKRIFEHDRNMAAEAVKTDITLAIVHDAEELLESARIAAEQARKRLNDARLQLRLKRKEFKNDGENYEESNDDFSDVSINIRELDDVLMKDVGNKIAGSGKWPLLIDAGKQAATFLRYRDTNYINCCNPRQMEPEAIRLSLLGAIKYGKFLVLDVMDVEGLWEGVEQRMNLVQKDLLQNLMNMSLIKENKFQGLCKDSDGDEYSPKALLSARVHEFKLVVLTQLDFLPKDFTEQFYVIKVHASQPV